MIHRVLVAGVVGLLAGLFAYSQIMHDTQPFAAYDFTWGWRAARYVVDGINPYKAMQPTGPYPFNSTFKYPLPYAILSLPFAWLSPRVAMATFGGGGAALLAFALIRDNYWRLILMVSGPVLATLALGQSSLYIVGAALLPGVEWLGFCIKPTAALATFTYRPAWRTAVIGTALAFTACLVILPSWPIEWLRAIQSDPARGWYAPAVMIPGGPLLLLAAFRWKTPEGWLLLALAGIPQNQSFYSGVSALLVARTFREALVLSVISLVGRFGWTYYDWRFSTADLIDPVHQAPWLLMSVYLPALVVVLRRPNAEAPARAE